MRSALYAGVLIVLAFTLCVASSSSVGAATTQHESVGPIAGTVVAPENERGVVVKAGPSSSDRSLGILRNGTKVKNYLEFQNGWVRVRTPFHGGWVQASYIQPQTAPAVVASVDQPDNCLRVRDGPGSEFEVVGCLAYGETLTLTGLWTEDNWAQISAPVSGWVYASQISTSLAPSYGPLPVPVQQASVRTYPVAYEQPVIVDTDDYIYDYSYPADTYFYAGYPWYYWGPWFHKRFHKKFHPKFHPKFHTKNFYGKDFKHFGKSRRWDGRNWYVNRGRNAVASIGRRGGVTRLGVASRSGGVRIGASRGGARIGVSRRGAGFRVGASRGSGFRISGASRRGGFRVGNISRGGGFRVGGARGGFGGRIGGMSMRSGGGGFRGGRGGFRR